ncbi:MAG: protein translocase subunit SecF [Acidimicrobiales bacterium]|nr:protein translocase subunit SecF [Acidimicrobiales bacterium]
MPARRPNVFLRLFRGETAFDFAGRWRRWFAISGLIIVVGIVSLGTRGLNFSIDFRGGTVWEVPSKASVSEVRSVVDGAVPGFGQSTIQILTNSQTGQRTVKVEAAAKLTGNANQVSAVTNALAKMADVSPNEVQLNDVGPSWGSDITNKAIEAVIIFLIVVTIYIWLRFEGKMAIAALVALIHDIMVTVGIYSLSGLQVSPDTVIAFLTILGYSLYDTIVVFDRVQENTRGLASTNRLTYSDTVNLSMNQVLARSLTTSLVAIMPILSILVIGAWVLGATALEDFGLALFVGLTTGAYSSIFIASPLLALLKEREPRYAEIRKRLAQSGRRRLTPAAVANAPLGDDLGVEPSRPLRSGARVSGGPGQVEEEVEYGAPPPVDATRAPGGSIPLRTPVGNEVPPRSGNRPPPRPRKKGRRR